MNEIFVDILSLQIASVCFLFPFFCFLFLMFRGWGGLEKRRTREQTALADVVRLDFEGLGSHCLFLVPTAFFTR